MFVQVMHTFPFTGLTIAKINYMKNKIRDQLSCGGRGGERGQGEGGGEGNPSNPTRKFANPKSEHSGARLWGSKKKVNN